MSKQLVLISGATGHLGFRTLVIALETGYRARIAVRKLDKAENLKNTPSIQPYLDSIEFVQVPDITAPGAYLDAIKDVDFVLHIASPIYSGFSQDEKDWKKLLYDPAKKGTTSILQAATKEPSVKRVVITSSCVVVEPKNGYTRAGPYDIKTLPDETTINNFPSAPQAYVASKVLAHLAADKFIMGNKVGFDLVRVLPGYIQGANELYTSDEQMRDGASLGSNEGTMNTALGNQAGRPRVTSQVFLDDVAKAHVFSLKEEVGKNGSNFLVVGNGGDSIPWSDFVPIMQRLFPDAVAKGVINPKAEDESLIAAYDVSSSETALGFKFAGPEEMAKSVVGQYLKLVGSP